MNHNPMVTVFYQGDRSDIVELYRAAQDAADGVLGVGRVQSKVLR
ncbi:MAG TPA: hypothetical protein VNY04_02700 [Chthoniobacterales bacterium]|jgi:hypothetical protein|nr:hypothetical protein [Chthoniobacterales bacterium]